MKAGVQQRLPEAICMKAGVRDMPLRDRRTLVQHLDQKMQFDWFPSFGRVRAGLVSSMASVSAPL